MGLVTDYPDDFEEHEIKSYRRKGTQVRSEYERLNPDGTVTKTVAWGDVRQGLRYKTYKMGLDGSVREIAPEHPAPRAVSARPHAAPQPQIQPRPHAVPPQVQPRPHVVPQQPRAQTPQPSQQPQPDQRKAFAFVMEPKEGGWKIHPFGITQDKPVPAAAAAPPARASDAALKDGPLPWWYSTLKDMINNVVDKQEKPKVEEPKYTRPPTPAPLEAPKPKKCHHGHALEGDLFHSSPFKSLFDFPRPNNFPGLRDFDSAFDDPFFTEPPKIDNFFNSPLLEGF